MIENITDVFNVGIIKVTIKDKPDVQKKVSEDNLKSIFEALKLYAQRERRIREVQTSIRERNSKRKLRYYFDTWYNSIITMSNISVYTKTERQTSKDQKIESFINAIAEKQTGFTPVNESKQSECQKHSGRRRNSVNFKKAQADKQKRPPDKNVKIKTISRVPTENRLKAQKVIIEEQRAKLAEQNKIIQNIKFKEMDKETKETTKQTINVAKQALTQCNRRTRRSLIYLIREEGCREP